MPSATFLRYYGAMTTKVKRRLTTLLCADVLDMLAQKCAPGLCRGAPTRGPSPWGKKASLSSGRYFGEISLKSSAKRREFSDIFDHRPISRGNRAGKRPEA